MSATHIDALETMYGRDPSPARAMYPREQEAMARKEVMPSGQVAARKEVVMNSAKTHAVCGKSVVADAKPGAMEAAGRCIGN